MMLEAVTAPTASFVTLTYNEESDIGTLVPDHLQKWLKRVRRNAGPCRFFGVGEYGSRTSRPHYHIALFGLGLAHQELLEDAWSDGKTHLSRGYVHVGDLTLQSAAYVAGYTCKKLVDGSDDRFVGKGREFARMSLRPGIGYQSLGQVAAALRGSGGQRYVRENYDVPDVLQHGSIRMPLGRYLRGRLRVELGLDEKQSVEASFLAAQKVRSMLAAYVLPGETELQSWKALHRKEVADAQRALNQENRYRLRSRKL